MNVTDEQVLTAVLAALNAGGPEGSANAQELDELKKLSTLPEAYTECSVTRRFAENPRNDTTTGTDAYRIIVRQCAEKNRYNAREMRRRTRANLEYMTLTAGGFASTPVRFESADDIDEDDQGYWSGLETYTLTF